MAEVHAEDREWLTELAKDHFLSSFRYCVEFFDEQIRKVVGIREGCEKPRDKLEATRLICEIEAAAMNLLGYGETVILADKYPRQHGSEPLPSKNVFKLMQDSKT